MQIITTDLGHFVSDLLAEVLVVYSGGVNFAALLEGAVNLAVLVGEDVGHPAEFLAFLQLLDVGEHHPGVGLAGLLAVATK